MKKKKIERKLTQSIQLDANSVRFSYKKLLVQRQVIKRTTKNNMRSRKIKLYNGDKIKPCHWCGIQLSFNDATLDHILDQADGGTNRKDNLVIACHNCNGKRGCYNETARRGHITRQVAERLFLKYLELKIFHLT